MDKTIKYKKIVKQLMEEIASISPSGEQVETQLIMDEERGHYLLYSVGWEGKNWIYSSFVHLDVKSNGKVWLQHDGTDLKIAEELTLKGVPKCDIVIGFQPPHARELMEEYAVA